MPVQASLGGGVGWDVADDIAVSKPQRQGGGRQYCHRPKDYGTTKHLGSCPRAAKTKPQYKHCHRQPSKGEWGRIVTMMDSRATALPPEDKGGVCQRDGPIPGLLPASLSDCVCQIWDCSRLDCFMCGLSWGNEADYLRLLGEAIAASTSTGAGRHACCG